MNYIYQISNIGGKIKMRECELVKETKHHVYIGGNCTEKLRRYSAGWKWVYGKEKALIELNRLLALEHSNLLNQIRAIEEERKKWYILTKPPSLSFDELCDCM